MTTFLRPITPEAENAYTEHATTTELLGRERIKNRGLMILLKVCLFVILIQIFMYIFLFVLGFRADRFFYSECVSYPKLPLPVPTPIQK